MSPYMNVEQCSEYIKFAVATLYKMIHYKKIPYRKHGARVIFHRDEIDAWSLERAHSVKVEKPLSKFRQTQQRQFQEKNNHGNC